jgi:hypothetical protein
MTAQIEIRTVVDVGDAAAVVVVVVEWLVPVPYAWRE